MCCHVQNSDDDKNYYRQGEGNPERGKNPQPGPGDFTEELKDDEDDCQESSEADATTGA